LQKLHWVLEFAASLGADVLCTGDVFSHTLYGNHFRHEVKMALLFFKVSGGSFYSCGGNHSGDVEGADASTTIYRELGQFCFDGYIKYLGKFNDVRQCYELPSGGVVAGFSAYSSVEEICDTPDFVQGLVCHHWIMDAFGDSLVVYPDDMKKMFPSLQFIVAGHDHSFHEPYVSRDGVLVVRPGSMMRTAAGDSSKRIPQVAVWAPDTNGWRFVEIGCARPYEEVFYVERRAVDSGSVGAISRFVKQMQENVNLVLDVDGVVRSQFEVVPEADKPLIKADLASNGFMV
jgi:hypothetical protein